MAGRPWTPLIEGGVPVPWRGYDKGELRIHSDEQNPAAHEIEVRAPEWWALIMRREPSRLRAEAGLKMVNAADAYWISAAGLVVLFIGVVGLVVNLARRRESHYDTA
jgi:hypothetical protein